MTETVYTPLVNQPSVSGGKFLYVPTHGMDVVVSNTSAQLTGDVEVLDFQLTVGLVTTLLGEVQERVLCEAFGSLEARISSLEKSYGVFGTLSAAIGNFRDVPNVGGGPMVVIKEGSPTSDDGPYFVGQLYFDKTNRELYVATSTASSSFWRKVITI